MPSYSATIQLTNGTLSVVRPHPSDEAADDLIDTALYAVRDGDSPVTSVGITIVTDGTPTLAVPPPADPDADDAPRAALGPLSS
jgi:hypothetical protein